MLPELTAENVQQMIRDIDENIKTLERQRKRAEERKSTPLIPGCNLVAVFPNSRAELYKGMISELKCRKCDLEHIKKDIERNQNDDYKKRTQKRDK